MGSEARVLRQRALRHPPGDPSNLIIWGLVASFLLATIFGFQIAGLKFDFGDRWLFPFLVALAAPLALLAWSGRPLRPNPRVRQGAAAAVQILCLLSSGLLLTCVVAALGANMPLQDRMLATLDASLGFDWVGYLRFVNAHPLLGAVFHLAYICMLPQFALVVPALAVTNNGPRLQAFTLAVGLSLTVTIAVFFFVPAATNYSALHLSAADYPNLTPVAQSGTWAQLLGSLRSELGYVVRLGTLDGMICFPSFHTSAAILFIWALWPLRLLRWPIAALNGLIIATTPVEGAHYLVDVIAGTIVAVGAIAMAQQCNRRRTGSGAELTARARQAVREDQGAYSSVIVPTPAARSRPDWVWMESGCNVKVPLLPPTSALAPTPTPTVAEAVPPA